MTIWLDLGETKSYFSFPKARENFFLDRVEDIFPATERIWAKEHFIRKFAKLSISFSNSDC